MTRRGRTVAFQKHLCLQVRMDERWSVTCTLYLGRVAKSFVADTAVMADFRDHVCIRGHVPVVSTVSQLELVLSLPSVSIPITASLPSASPVHARHEQPEAGHRKSRNPQIVLYATEHEL